MNDQQRSFIRRFIVGGAASAREAADAAHYFPTKVNESLYIQRAEVTFIDVRRLRTWPRALRYLEALWRRLTGDYRWAVEIEYHLPPKDDA